MLMNTIIDTFTVPGVTQSAGTVITALIPPYCGAKGEAKNLFSVDLTQTPGGISVAGLPNWWGPANCFAHITDVNLVNSSTQHQWFFLRPLNWTYFTAAVPKNTTAITLKDDPGTYSTNYRYKTPNAATPTLVADAAISSTNKYVVYQLADGTWQLDTIASGTFGGANLVLTTGTPNRTGATIAANSPLFYFGATSLSDPATGLVQPSLYSTVSSTQQIGSYAGSLYAAQHRGDPLLIVNANGTGQDYLGSAWGVYAKDW